MRTLYSNNQILNQDKKTTFLASDVVAGGSALIVDSIVGFAINQVILIGEIGNEQSEIIKTHSATSPTGSTITFASNLVFDHPRGTKIYLIDWDQVEFSHATTVAGSKSVLTTASIQPDQSDTQYTDSTQTTGYYFVRLKNSITATYSDYSDPIPYAGYADNSVHSIKSRALQDLGEVVGDTITDNFLNESLWEGRRELDQDPRVLRWSFREKINNIIGNIIPGTYTATLPTDLRDPKSNKNILSLRVGRNNTPLVYVDTNRFNQNYLNVAHTTLDGAVLDSDITIVLASSGDFDESGDISIAASTISGTIDIVAYTANTESTDTLSGVTGIVSGGHTTGKEVWQGGNFGTPIEYTIDGENGLIKFNIPFENNLAGENIYMDYYSTMPAYDSDADLLDEPETDMFTSYLKWKIKYRKSNGTIKPTEDGDYLEWEKRKKALIDKEFLGQEIHLVPDMD